MVAGLCSCAGERSVKLTDGAVTDGAVKLIDDRFIHTSCGGALEVCQCKLMKPMRTSACFDTVLIEGTKRFKCTSCDLPIAFVGRNAHLDLPELQAVRGGIDKHVEEKGRHSGRWQCGICSDSKPFSADNAVHGMMSSSKGYQGTFQRWCPTPSRKGFHCQSSSNKCKCQPAGRGSTVASRESASSTGLKRTREPSDAESTSFNSLADAIDGNVPAPIGLAAASGAAESAPIGLAAASSGALLAPSAAAASSGALLAPSAAAASSGALLAPSAAAASSGALLAPSADAVVSEGGASAPLHRGEGYIALLGLQVEQIRDHIASLSPDDASTRTLLTRFFEKTSALLVEMHGELQGEDCRSVGDESTRTPLFSARTPLLNTLNFKGPEGRTNLLALPLMQPEAMGPPPDKRVVLMPAPVAQPPVEVLQECAAVREAMGVDDLIWLQAVSLQMLPVGLLSGALMHVAGLFGEAEAELLVMAVATGPPSLVLLSAPSSSELGQRLAQAGVPHVVSWTTDCQELPRRLFAEGFWAAVRCGATPEVALTAGRERILCVETQRTQQGTNEWVPMLALADPAETFLGMGHLPDGRWAAGLPVLHAACSGESSVLPPEGRLADAEDRPEGQQNADDDNLELQAAIRLSLGEWDGPPPAQFAAGLDVQAVAEAIANCCWLDTSTWLDPDDMRDARDMIVKQCRCAVQAVMNHETDKLDLIKNLDRDTALYFLELPHALTWLPITEVIAGSMILPWQDRRQDGTELLPEAEASLLHEPDNMRAVCNYLNARAAQRVQEVSAEQGELEKWVQRLRGQDAINALAVLRGESATLRLRLLDLPAGLQQLKWLRRMDLHDCANLHAVTSLPALEVLHLSSQDFPYVTFVPPAIGQLVKLRELNLRVNHISELPEAVGDLVELEMLDVSYNKLTSLPSTMKNLCKLSYLDASENPLVLPPPELLKWEGRDNPRMVAPLVVAFFGDLLAHGSKRTSSAKLVLLGAGNAGKTSLLRGLQLGKPSPNSEADRTIQLELSTLTLRQQNGGPGDDDDDLEVLERPVELEPENLVHLSCWDFGGQHEAYAAVQQPYIVRGALYLLVVPADRANTADQAEVLEQWLDMLQVRAPGAVVQLVLTRIDLLPRSEQEKEAFEVEAGKMAARTVAKVIARAARMREDAEAVEAQNYWHWFRSFEVDDEPSELEAGEGERCRAAIRAGIRAGVRAGLIFSPTTEAAVFEEGAEEAERVRGEVGGGSITIALPPGVAVDLDHEAFLLLECTLLYELEGWTRDPATDATLLEHRAANAVHWLRNAIMAHRRQNVAWLGTAAPEPLRVLGRVLCVDSGQADVILDEYDGDSNFLYRSIATLDAARKRLTNLTAPRNLCIGGFAVRAISTSERSSSHSTVVPQQLQPAAAVSMVPVMVPPLPPQDQAAAAAEHQEAGPSVLNSGADLAQERRYSLLDGGEIEGPLPQGLHRDIPTNWLPAIALVTALRDGRDPAAAARALHSNESPPAPSKERQQYTQMSSLQAQWQALAPTIGTTPDLQTLDSAVALLEGQGQIFRSSGIVYLDPSFVCELVKALTDHRLTHTPAEGSTGSKVGLDLMFAEPCVSEYVKAARPANQQATSNLLEYLGMLVEHGELVEPLLPFLWRGMALRPQDYEAVLQMLCESGVLIELYGGEERGGEERRWAMPTRLPLQPPEGLERIWPAETPEGVSQIQLSFDLRAAFVPPGVVERAVAAVMQLCDQPKLCWRYGAFGFISAINANIRLQLERVGREHVPMAGGVGSRLVVTVREKQAKTLLHKFASKSELLEGCTKLLSQLVAGVETGLTAFPGLQYDVKLACPACKEMAHRWNWKDPNLQKSQLQQCSRCGESFCLARSGQGGPSRLGGRVEKHGVLCFASSPAIQPLQNSLDEALEVSHHCPAAIHRGGDLQTLQRELHRTLPRRFLFSGHADARFGDTDTTLMFTDTNGRHSTPDPQEVVNTLAQFTPPLELSVLNGCNSYALGCKLLRRNMQWVVCWRTKVADGAARKFAVAFFKELMRSDDVRGAFNEAKTAVKAVKRSGFDDLGAPVQVQKYVLRDPDLPTLQKSFTPAPINAGIPELLSLAGEDDE